MKNYFLIAITMLALAACSKDDDCNSESLATTILGSWNVYVLGQNQGEVEFKSDGTLVDENDLIIGGEIGGVTLDEKTYEVIGDDLLSTTAASGSSSIGFDYDIVSYSCDKIEFDFGGFNAELRR